MLLKEVVNLFDYYHSFEVCDLESRKPLYRFIPRPGEEKEEGELTEELLQKKVICIDSIGPYNARIVVDNRNIIPIKECVYLANIYWKAEDAARKVYDMPNNYVVFRENGDGICVSKITGLIWPYAENNIEKFEKVWEK